MSNILFFKKLENCLKENKPVFSRDIGNNGIKSFFCCDYTFFCHHFYKNLKKRHIYEVLQTNVPTKIYLDFDCKKVNLKNDFFDEINNVISTIKREIKKLFNFECNEIRLNSTSEQKLSMHVIFNFCFKNVEQIKHFVLKFCDEAKFLDKSIYTKNRSFRLIYSSKQGKNEKLLLENNDKDEYNSEIVMQTLLQNFKKNKVFDFKNNNQSETQISAFSYSSNTNVFLPFGDLISVKENKDCILAIVKNVYCPFKQKVHKSNNTFFTKIKSNGFSFYKCSDSDCPGIYFGQHFQKL